MDAAEIKTIKTGNEHKLKEKGSLFISQAFNIKTEQEAADCLKSVKKRYFDAAHHCYAYRLSDGAYKSSDDGEPSGSAGIRILNAIDHYALTNLVVIVTRYFGGTKLGIGPLGKAYYSSAENALASLKIITLKLYYQAEISVLFDYINPIHKILKDSDSRIETIDYSDSVTFKCMIKPEETENIKENIINMTKGTAGIKISGKIYLI